MIYLTKTEDRKLHHFRAAVEGSHVHIVHGVFYTWMEKYAEGCASGEAARARQKKLLEEKLRTGFRITEFSPMPQNSINIYDQVKWHAGGFPEELPRSQAYVCTGLFLSWLIGNNLVSREFRENHSKAIRQYYRRELTGAQVFAGSCGGMLLLEDLNETGNRFALSYFCAGKGGYTDDYDHTLVKGLSSHYYVADTWYNYSRLKPVLDKRFADWQRLSRKRPFWKLW